MQKKVILISVSIALTIFLLCLIIYNVHEDGRTSLKSEGIKYALLLDGKNVMSFPSKGLYKVKVSCKNATGIWLYDDWKLIVENITGEVSCDVEFETTTKKLFNDYIISLKGTTQGTGRLLSDTGYRYEGKNPNNYVWFNNEYWRIIGVFDSNDHGQSGKNMVKIIREDIIGGLSWHRSYVNDWSTSSLNSLLNGAYYNAQDGTSSGYCYASANRSNCDYTKKGIQSYYKSMIANVTWHLGGYSSTGATASAFYGYERGTTVYSGNSTTTDGYVGLVYPSDYGYSVLSSSCARTTKLSSYNNSSCAGQSWLYGKGDEWTLTHYSSSNNSVFSLSGKGELNHRINQIKQAFGVRPVLYLDSSVYIIDGDGSLDKPYIIGM